MTKETAKKTLGRRKIDIKRIENKSSLQVTFSKRRSGLFKKAGELSLVSGAHIGILVQSPSDKLFTFGDSIFDRFESGVNNSLSSSDDRCRMEYEEALRQLEVEKKRMKELDGTNGNCWWDDTFEGMDLFELENFGNALEGLVDRVLNRADAVAELYGCDVVELPNSNLLVQDVHIQEMEDEKLDGGVDHYSSSMENIGYGSDIVQENELIDIDELLNSTMENVDYGSNIGQENEFIDIEELLMNCPMENVNYGSGIVQENELIYTDELLNFNVDQRPGISTR